MKKFSTFMDVKSIVKRNTNFTAIKMGKKLVDTKYRTREYIFRAVVVNVWNGKLKTRLENETSKKEVLFASK